VPNITWDGEKAKLKVKEADGTEKVHDIPILTGKFTDE
jgi:hypothetical protein